jgi:hypothetical protein
MCPLETIRPRSIRIGPTREQNHPLDLIPFLLPGNGHQRLSTLAESDKHIPKVKAQSILSEICQFSRLITSDLRCRFGKGCLRAIIVSWWATWSRDRWAFNRLADRMSRTYRLSGLDDWHTGFSWPNFWLLTILLLVWGSTQLWLWWELAIATICCATSRP